MNEWFFLYLYSLLLLQDVNLVGRYSGYAVLVLAHGHLYILIQNKSNSWKIQITKTTFQYGKEAFVGEETRRKIIKIVKHRYGMKQLCGSGFIISGSRKFDQSWSLTGSMPDQGNQGQWKLYIFKTSVNFWNKKNTYSTELSEEVVR